jgi:outer membrane protein OmpA-like peptidoglycan-associated protein
MTVNPCPRPTRAWRSAALLTAAFAFVSAVVSSSGCASRAAAPPPPAPAPANPASPAPPPAATATPVEPTMSTGSARGKPLPSLAPERKYLAERFAGTPVTIDFDDTGALVVDVPLKFAFDPGRDQVKPALKKVLDYVATSLRRVSATTFAVQAPADAKPDPALAERRAKAVSAYVVSRAVPVQRAGGASAGTGSGVRVLIVADKPQP